MDIVRPGEAGANPSGLGGLTVHPGTLPPPSPAGTADVIKTGLKGGSGVSEGYQIKLDLDSLKGGDRP